MWTDASCRGLLDLFFDERPDSVSVAKALCHVCPHTNECLENSLRNAEAYGVWGGLDYQERKVVAASLGYPIPSRRSYVEHGTPRGYAWHQREQVSIELDRNGVDICGCLEAHRAAARERVRRYRKRLKEKNSQP